MIIEKIFSTLLLTTLGATVPYVTCVVGHEQSGQGQVFWVFFKFWYSVYFKFWHLNYDRSGVHLIRGALFPIRPPFSRLKSAPLFSHFHPYEKILYVILFSVRIKSSAKPFILKKWADPMFLTKRDKCSIEYLYLGAILKSQLYYSSSFIM